MAASAAAASAGAGASAAGPVDRSEHRAASPLVDPWGSRRLASDFAHTLGAPAPPLITANPTRLSRCARRYRPAEYDLTMQMAKFLDPQLVLLMLDFLEAKAVRLIAPTHLRHPAGLGATPPAASWS